MIIILKYLLRPLLKKKREKEGTEAFIGAVVRTALTHQLRVSHTLLLLSQFATNLETV